MAYIKTEWENEPSESTPINAENLNKMEDGIYNNSQNIGNITTLKTTNKTNIVNAINELKDGEIYSTSEINTGKKWIDNKPIYRKIIVVDPYTSGGNININELNIENITNLQALRKYNNQTDINYYNNSNDYFRVLIRKYNNQFVITLQGSNSGQAKVEIILEYTKAS